VVLISSQRNGASVDFQNILFPMDPSYMDDHFCYQETRQSSCFLCFFRFYRIYLCISRF